VTKETAALEAEMEATRERLAGTIDQLVHRASPKTIARREITSLKGYFVDLETGQPRTTNILKVAGGLVGVGGNLADQLPGARVGHCVLRHLGPLGHEVGVHAPR
jgi:hypothetical protein